MTGLGPTTGDLGGELASGGDLVEVFCVFSREEMGDLPEELKDLGIDGHAEGLKVVAGWCSWF